SKQVLVDDYAHHPREISATIETARKKYPNKDVVAVFQPHTFSRTQAFLDEFADALSKADHVFLCEIFGSIRENTGELTIQDLINRIDGSALIDENSIDVLEKFDNAVILFMGAGDIQKIQGAYEEKIGMSKEF
ncbi:MAG: cyanophycin synthetase, partial [Staphylococcus sp.]|nr:cyanophycin synthetase [Staphylococcus sp.]